MGLGQIAGKEERQQKVKGADAGKKICVACLITQD